METRLRPDFVTKHSAELQQFFYNAQINGYGNPMATIFKGRDGGTTIEYVEGPWCSEDTYYGGEPYSGMMVITRCQIVCFTMIYWGKVLPEANIEEVYKCLQAALMAVNPLHPWRGPNQFTADNGLRYTNIWHGDINKFYGQEKIGDSHDNWLYECDYRGGIVNLR